MSGNTAGRRDIGIFGDFGDGLAGKFKTLLTFGATSATRDIGITGSFDDDLAGNLERLLGLGKTSLRRDIGITGAFTDETDLKFRKLLSANTAARRDIGIAGAFTDMPDKIKTLLGAAFTTGTRKVGITSGFDPAMSAFMVDLLSKDTTGARDIGITGAIDASPAMRRLLSMDTTTATRGITATLDDDGISPLGQRFLTQLAAVGDVSRGIAGSLTVAAMDKTGGQFWRQLMSGVTTTAKTISGLVSVLPMTDDAGQFWQRLLAGASTTRQNIAGKLSVFGMGEVEAGYFGLLTGGFKSVPRGIAGKLSVDRMTPVESSYFGLLTNAFTAPTRGINGKLSVYKMGAVEADYWTLLTDAFTAPMRGITGKLTVDAMTGTAGDFWRQLLAGSSTVAKTIAGGITGVTQATGLSWVADKFLHQIIAGDGIFTKTIMGGVNIDGLDGRQLALLDAIRGANAGLLTVGGSFKFAPEAAFSTWFGDTLKTGITTPMSVLSLALGDLRKAVADQIAAEKGREVASALTNAAAGTLTGPMGANILGKDKIEELARIAGINIADHNAKGGTLQGLADRVAGFSAYDSIKAIVADPTGDRTKALLFEHLTDPGLMVNPGEYKKHVIPEWASKPQMHFEQIGLQQLLDGTRAFRPETFNWKTIGLNVPGFADGGIHAGGLRMVGERGPELEYTGPSRITSNSDLRAMFDMREVVAELRAVKAELHGMKAQDKQIGTATVSSIKDGNRTPDQMGRRWNSGGTGMKVLPSIIMTNAIMTATNVPEDDAAEWDISTTYDAGDHVIVATAHLVYESVVGTNLGNTLRLTTERNGL
ncbi:MAG: hypothetical protein IPL79_20400 [Myxococcales bacterium]|nr:hypothetical protein [Myxococcales bacterium]